MFKGLPGIAGDNLFERASDFRTRGHTLKLKNTTAVKILENYSFSERVVSRWNALDEEAVSVTTANLFTSMLIKIA